MFNFVLKAVLVTNLQTSDILSSTSHIFVLKALLVTNPLRPGTLLSTSPIFVLKAVLVTKLQVSGIVYQNFLLFI